MNLKIGLGPNLQLNNKTPNCIMYNRCHNRCHNRVSKKSTHTHDVLNVNAPLAKSNLSIKQNKAHSSKNILATICLLLL